MGNGISHKLFPSLSTVSLLCMDRDGGSDYKRFEAGFSFIRVAYSAFDRRLSNRRSKDITRQYQSQSRYLSRASHDMPLR